MMRLGVDNSRPRRYRASVVFSATETNQTEKCKTEKGRSPDTFFIFPSHMFLSGSRGDDQSPLSQSANNQLARRRKTFTQAFNSIEGVYMFSPKIIHSLVLFITVGVTICRPEIGDHALNSSVQPARTRRDSMAGSTGVIVYDKEGSRSNKDKEIIRLFNNDGSLWYEFSFYDDNALSYLKKPNADFTPFRFDPDIFVLALKCLRSDAGRYEVIVNEESRLRKFVKRDDPILKFQRWEEHVVKWSRVEFDVSTNPARSKPDINADVIRIPSLPKDYVIGFYPDKIEGDWLRVRWNLSESGAKYQRKDEFGWVRWRDKENNLIVRPLK